MATTGKRSGSGPAVLPLPKLIRASSEDAANMAMRAAGRKAWSEGDYNVAVDTFNRLRTACYGEGVRGCIRFGIAEELERAGYLSLYMKAKEFFALIDAAEDYADNQFAMG